SHNGARVVPGEYTLRLTTDQEELSPVEVKVTVHADPRIEADPADYGAQKEALRRIFEMAGEVHETVNRFRRVKSRLSGTIAMLKDLEDQTELLEQARLALNEINDWESQLIQIQQKTFQDVINFRNQLNAELVYLAGQLDSNEPAPTAGCLLRLDELSTEWNASQETLSEITEGSLRVFNDSYRASGLPVVIVPPDQE
ncbi:MAG: glycosyl hydrolase, partial [Planctomycetota bacterium]